MNTGSNSRFYYPQLDGLRFLAFLLVFIHNAFPVMKETLISTISEYGWIGVDLFFCLSAFLITKLLVNESNLIGKISIRNFYIRRILRIWPLYYFYMALAFTIMAPVLGPIVNIPGHIVALSTFTFNFAYFALLPSPFLIVIHLWSISYEEQFYAVIPWFLRKTLRFTMRKKWFILGGAFALGNTIRAIFILLRLPPSAIYFLPFTHFDSILGGLALGLGLLDKPFNRIRSWTLPLGIFLNSLILLLPNNDILSWGLMLTYPLVGLGMSLIVYAAINQNYSLLAILLQNKPFIFLGRISYGLYIFHFGCLALAGLIMTNFFNIQPAELGSHYIQVMGIAFILTILSAVITYNAIEKPFLKLKVHFSYIKSRPV